MRPIDWTTRDRSTDLPIPSPPSATPPAPGSRRRSRRPRRPGARLGRHQRGTAHADPGADRLGQDAGGLPVVPRPAGDRAAAGGPGAARAVRRPLKALAYDVERNLRAPLVGIRRTAAQLGIEAPDITVATRTGDTSADERRDLARTPPDILVTTPESLYLLLTSQAREILRGVERVIVDEIHAMAATKRGAHLALSLERLEHLPTSRPQRIGLSATQRPLAEIARFLGGAGARSRSSTPASARSSTSRSSCRSRTWRAWATSWTSTRRLAVRPPAPRRALDLAVRPPAAARADPGHGRRWSSSTPAAWPNAWRRASTSWPRRSWSARTTARSPASSASRSRSAQGGHAAGLVATSARARHRHGRDRPRRAGRVAAVGRQRACSASVAPATRSASPASAKSSRSFAATWSRRRSWSSGCWTARSRRRASRATRSTCWPSRSWPCARTSWTVDDLHGCAPRLQLPRPVARAVRRRARHAGRPLPVRRVRRSQAAPRLGPRRRTRSRAQDARVVAVTSGGTIPDRGLYGVFLPATTPGGPRSASSTRRWCTRAAPARRSCSARPRGASRRSRRERVIVTPAPGEPGKMPFWHGDAAAGRSSWAGPSARSCASSSRCSASGRAGSGRPRLDELAARNLLPTSTSSGRSPARAHRPQSSSSASATSWATGACASSRRSAAACTRRGRWRSRRSCASGSASSPVDLDRRRHRLALPEAVDGRRPLEPRSCSTPTRSRTWSSASWAARRCSPRASARTRRARCCCRGARPGQRTPLWQRASGRRPAGRGQPVRLVPDPARDLSRVPARRVRPAGAARAARRNPPRQMRVMSVDTRSASPFARSLLFAYVAAFMYEGDAPLAERRAQALTLDRELLRRAARRRSCASCSIPGRRRTGARAAVARRTPRARDPRRVHDLLRRLGDLHRRARGPLDRWPRRRSCAARARGARRAVRVRIAGEERWIAVEDVARYRDALGVPPPPGVPETFLEATDRAARHAARALGAHPRARSPPRSGRPLGPGARPVDDALGAGRRPARCRASSGPAAPHASCDPDVLRQLRRRSLARLRREVEPVRGRGARPLPAGLAWRRSGCRQPRSAPRGRRPARGRADSRVGPRARRPARARRGYTPRLLDELGAAGEVVWVGRGTLGRDDGRVALYRRDRALLAPPARSTTDPTEPIHDAIREHLQRAARRSSRAPRRR